MTDEKIIIEDEEPTGGAQNAESEEGDENADVVVEDGDGEEESENVELDEEDEESEGDESDGREEDEAADGDAPEESETSLADERAADAKPKADDGEVERLKRELAAKDKLIERQDGVLRRAGYTDDEIDRLAKGETVGIRPPEKASRPDSEEDAEVRFATEKRQADYDLVTMKYPWAANEQKSVDGFGEKFLRVMQYNEDKMTALDAFEISHAAEIDAHRHKEAVNADIRAAERRAVRNMQNKEHQKGVGKSGGGNAVVVPRAVYEQYKAFNPDASDREIARHYKKDTK